MVMFSRVTTLMALVAFITILVMMNFTTPAGIGPFGVLVFFGLVYMVMFGLATIVVNMFLSARGQKDKKTKKHDYYAAVLAFGPILLLLVRAVGGLNPLTIGLIVLFVLLGCFLVNKRF